MPKGATGFPSRFSKVLVKAERLRRASVFKRVYAAKKSISKGIVTLYVLPKLGKNQLEGQGRGSTAAAKLPGSSSKEGGFGRKPPLAGFVVAKKVSKSACARNRAKRRVREAYRLIRKESPITANDTKEGRSLFLNQWYAIVFVVNQEALTSTWEEIEESVRDSLAEANERYGARR